MPRPWTFEERKFVIQHARLTPVVEMAVALGRRQHDIRREASLMGVRLRRERRSIVFCPGCSQGRTRLVGGKGVCRVCNVRALEARARAEIARELLGAPLEVRSGFGRFEGVRGNSKPMPPKPAAPAIHGKPPSVQQALWDGYLAEVEEWEYVAARRKYDAKRKQLCRLRVLLGGL